jgi:hypothetical protein
MKNERFSDRENFETLDVMLKGITYTPIVTENYRIINLM